MALDKRAWRCQKGHGAQEKGHGAAPCYFALDLTLALYIQPPEFKSSIIPMKFDSKELWPGHRFRVCVHCDLDLGDMILGQIQGHDTTLCPPATTNPYVMDNN